MKITIVCAGKIKEKYLTAGIAEFMKRLKPFAQVEIREIHEEKMPDSPSEAEKEQVLAKEGEKLLKLVPEGSYLIVLDVYGKNLSSECLRLKNRYSKQTLIRPNFLIHICEIFQQHAKRCHTE